ncbi:MAG: PIG-L family deacetylase [Anaerolineales bacterium]
MTSSSPSARSTPPLSGSRMLVALAHPDDESFGLGGTLALYARRGVEIHLVMGTRGEAGTVAAEFLQDGRTVPELRLAELDCAAKTLGLGGVSFLGFRDSGMAGSDDNRRPDALAAAPVEEVAARMVRALRTVRPHVVLTHDPRGGYGHPDHIAMHRGTLRAFHLAAQPDFLPEAGPPHAAAKLYYQIFGRTWLRRVMWLLPLFGMNPRRFGRNKDMDLTEITSVEYPAHARLDIQSVLDVKRAAGACHASQQMPSVRGPLAFILRPSAGWESYFRAHPGAPLDLHETDLFQGVDLSAA